MQFSNDNINWSAPETYAISKAWTLSSGDGTKPVYVKFKDGAGNWSSAYSDTILLDTSAPNTTSSILGGTYSGVQSVTLSCNDGAGSGCSSTYYCIGTGCTTMALYSSPINITGSSALRFYSSDAVGNAESIRTETYVISYTVTPTAGINGSISPSTPQTVNYNETASFTITPGAGYHIASVIGCSGTLSGDTYTTGAVTGNCTVTATFEPYSVKKISGASAAFYSSLQDACNAAAGGDIIESQAITLNESLNFTLNVPITLKGGYNSDFTSKTGYTIINGLTISNGSIILENIVIQ
jgi:hypothetical protein